MKRRQLPALSSGLCALCLSLGALSAQAQLAPQTVLGTFQNHPLYEEEKALPYIINERGDLIAEGDIIVGSAKDLRDSKPLSLSDLAVLQPFSVKFKSATLWTFGIVPFEIAPSAQGKKSEIEDAIRHIQKTTKIEFTPITSQSKHGITFVGIDSQTVGGESSYGMVGKRQKITVAGSAQKGTIVHEIGHALGLAHEHMRNDRDSFIKYREENVMSGFGSQFKILHGSQGPASPSYDYASVMHYWSTAFGKETTTKDPVTNEKRMITMEPLNGTPRKAINFKQELSKTDKENIDALYAGEIAKRDAARAQGLQEVLTLKFE